MPTYSFRCEACGSKVEHVSSMRAYIDDAPVFIHCNQPMQRFFEFAPGLASANALAGDRHYDGMRAPDGTDISSRTKHRAYMKAKGVTTIDDYSGTWKRDAKERAERLAGEDRSRANDVAQAIAKHGG